MGIDNHWILWIRLYLGLELGLMEFDILEVLKENTLQRMDEYEIHEFGGYVERFGESQ
jgi:hypothetical protein